uniref:olfactory receptor 1052-like n=1 Tax=Halichoerus grypus TaxID=9711 RepID=UPI00165A127B|nr:olfactory receptor 1052-like [Halichoerus grypus]
MAENGTVVTEFILLGFQLPAELQMGLFFVFLVLYFITLAILKIRTASGKAKTFSTCASHTIAVALFFGTLIFIYLKGNMSKSLGEDKIVSVFYTVVIPMLNPMIYSLRNKKVKEALKKALNGMKVSQVD